MSTSEQTNGDAREIEVEGANDEATEMPNEAEADSRIAELEAALAAGKETVLRAQAEMENYRRRAAREVESARKFALERIMQDLLEVRDSIERGLEVAHADQATVTQLTEGNELTFRLFEKVLVSHGIEVIDPVGEAFDPEKHEAMSMVPTNEQAPDTVVTVIQKGFLLNDRLLRPARVLVAQATA
ncbi:MAG: nucleotide exchange factor GrpE [Pseudomonadota bacterium]